MGKGTQGIEEGGGRAVGGAVTGLTAVGRFWRESLDPALSQGAGSVGGGALPGVYPLVAQSWGGVRGSSERRSSSLANT